MLDLVRDYIYKTHILSDRLECLYEIAKDPAFLVEEFFKARYTYSGDLHGEIVKWDARVFEEEVYFWVERSNPETIPLIEDDLLKMFKGFSIFSKVVVDMASEELLEVPAKWLSGGLARYYRISHPKPIMTRVCWRLKRNEA